MPSFWAVRKSSSPASPQHLRERLCEMPKNSHIYSPSNLRRLVRVPIAPDYDEACDALATHPEEQPEFGNRRKVRTEKVCFGTPTGHKNLRLGFLHSHNEDSDGSTVTSSKLVALRPGTESKPPGRPQSARPSQSSSRRRRGNKFVLPDRHIRSSSLAARPSMPEVRCEKNDIASTEGARLPAGPTREHSDDTDLRSRLKRVEDGVERIRRKLLMSAGDAKSGSTKGGEEPVVRPCRTFKLGKRRLLEEPVQPNRGERCQPLRSEALALGKSPCPPRASSGERLASVTEVSTAIQRCVDRLCSKRLDDYTDLASMPPHSRKAAARLFDVISIDLECLRRQIRQELARLRTCGSAEDQTPRPSCNNRASRQSSTTTAPALPQFAGPPSASAVGFSPTLLPTYHRREFDRADPWRHPVREEGGAVPADGRREECDFT
ncbi:hypothetical protein FOZ63_027217 [Perkinsus olseni]|uniref:Uncharacterized protein n=1 Tax=Perkinsus olseni TaxID=32597 RepID=A0A7J6RTA1_PEROL|nr:hypothetical protein FOZ63_027217 [Perkinsus olseni]